MMILEIMLQIVIAFTCMAEERTSAFHLEFRNPEPIGLQADWVIGFNFEHLWVKFFSEPISVLLVNSLWTSWFSSIYTLMCSVIAANCVDLVVVGILIAVVRSKIEIIEVLGISISDRTCGVFWTTTN